jgi:hypothetical protein
MSSEGVTASCSNAKNDGEEIASGGPRWYQSAVWVWLNRGVSSP